MKDKLNLTLHNTKAVFRRNTDVILHLVFTVISVLAIKFFGNYLVFWIPLVYNAVSLVWNLFEFVLDMLDSVFNVPHLSDFRKRFYDNKILRIKNRLKKRNKTKDFLMPYQSGSPMGVPSVIHSNMNQL